MKTTALAIVDDLRRRKLLPVAVLLLVAVVALPVLALKPADDAPAPAPTATATPASNSGLPSPEEALNGSEKPLVTLAVLKESSDLDAYSSRNPFKPLVKMAAEGDAAAGGTPAATKETSSGGSDSSGGGSGSDSGSSGGGGATTTTPTDTAPTTTPKSGDEPKTTTKRLTYALDLTFGRSGSKPRSFKNFARLRMLPSQTEPLFVYLGIDATGTKAVFLVDSSLTVTSGEGNCKPSNDSCATVEIAPGEISRFKDASGRAYQLEVDQIRVVSAAKSAAAAEKFAKAAAAADPKQSARRFMPPVLSDLFVAQSR